MSKKKLRKFTFLYQGISLMFLLIFLVGFTLSKGLSFRIFGFITSDLSIVIFTGLEFIFIIIYSFLSKKLIRLVWIIPLIPILLVEALGGLFALEDSSYKLKLDNYDKTLFVESSSSWLSGDSTIYEIRNIFFIKEIVQISGDDGHTPLADREYYDIIYYQNGVEIIYDFGTNQKDEDGHKIYSRCYLVYRNDTIEVGELEDLIPES